MMLESSRDVRMVVLLKAGMKVLEMAMSLGESMEKMLVVKKGIATVLLRVHPLVVQ